MIKKENKDALLRIFFQEELLQEWAEKQGIKLKYEHLDVYPDKTIQEGEDEATPAERMGLRLKELWEGNDNDKKGIIS